MRPQDTDSRPQPPMRPPQTTPRTPPAPPPQRPRRPPPVATLLPCLPLATGVAVLLGLLPAELIPAIHALVGFPSSAVLVSDQPWAPREDEPLGLVPFTLDDWFAR